MVDKLFVAMKAFIVYKGKILIVRESARLPTGTNPNKFDVVGGRLEPGEKFDECLVREVKEETGLKIKIGKPFFVGEWRPKVRGEQWQIVGTYFECEAMTDKVILNEEHDKYEWINPKEYKKYNLIPNLIPAFEVFLKR